MSERSDRTHHLVVELKAGGDREAIFRELFDLWRRPIHAFFRRNGVSGEDAGDLAQETYLRVYRGIDRFRGDSRFEAWLYGIAANVRQKEIRKRRTIKRDMKEIPLEDVTVEPASRPTASNPEGRLFDKERRELVRAEVETMPPQMQRCFKLWAEGFKYREIAELMDITIDAVRGHLGAAKARLKSRLGGASDGEDAGSD